MKFGPTSRILFFAPHPDDESLASGGLLQKAAAAGAGIEVIFLTNGDDNAWPLRVLERQWKIDGKDRALWGMRRLQEALQALDALGVPRAGAHFLHLPDQGMTDFLLRGGVEVVAQLRKIISAARPTLLLGPAPFDLHPDHNAVSVLLHLALASPEFQSIQKLYYAVHTRGYHADYRKVSLRLNACEQEGKRRAILCHRSQMLLSRKRFLRHVKDREDFWSASIPRRNDLDHPIRHGALVDGFLTLHVHSLQRARPIGRSTLYIALEGGATQSARWKLRLPNESGEVPLRDATSDAVVDVVEVHVRRGAAVVHIPVEMPAWPLTHIFVKFRPRTLFYDRAGWREIPVPKDAAGPLRAGVKLKGRKCRFAACDQIRMGDWPVEPG